MLRVRIYEIDQGGRHPRTYRCLEGSRRGPLDVSCEPVVRKVSFFKCRDDWQEDLLAEASGEKERVSHR